MQESWPSAGQEKVRIGVLGIQGGVAEHLAMLSKLDGVEANAFIRAGDLERLDGIILPGGESTAMGKLLNDFGLTEQLRSRIQAGLPVWGTCAGMILLAKELVNDKRRHLAIMDISVDRNAYGSQLHSFMHEGTITGLEGKLFPMIFVRAPRITRVGKDVRILASLHDNAVACREGTMVATAFHPELSEDPRFHAWFASFVREARQSRRESLALHVLSPIG